MVEPLYVGFKQSKCQSKYTKKNYADADVNGEVLSNWILTTNYQCHALSLLF